MPKINKNFNFFQAVATGEVKISWGVVVEVDEMEAHVLDEKNGILVTLVMLKTKKNLKNLNFITFCKKNEKKKSNF